MANIANTIQSRKQVRHALKRRGRNFSQRSELRTAIKGVRIATRADDKAAVQKILLESASITDSIEDEKIIQNKAMRLATRAAYLGWRN